MVNTVEPTVFQFSNHLVPFSLPLIWLFFSKSFGCFVLCPSNFFLLGDIKYIHKIHQQKTKNYSQKLFTRHIDHIDLHQKVPSWPFVGTPSFHIKTPIKMKEPTTAQIGSSFFWFLSLSEAYFLGSGFAFFFFRPRKKILYNFFNSNILKHA